MLAVIFSVATVSRALLGEEVIKALDACIGIFRTKRSSEQVIHTVVADSFCSFFVLIVDYVCSCHYIPII